MTTPIGFVGQGWIGRHYADDFEQRGYAVVRYALEEPYVHNRDAIADCEIVFIAVPTPTTPEGFDASYVIDALTTVAPGSTVVIKSTLVPGTTADIQQSFPDLYVMHSPEFLVEATAAEDAAKPKRNLIGIPTETPEYIRRAEEVMTILPNAPYSSIMNAKEAELIKYAGNCFLYTKVVFMNLLYDVVSEAGLEWETIRSALVADPRIGESHTQPVHTSGHDRGNSRPVRGAGGHCFIKDYEAFRTYFKETVGDQAGLAALTAYQTYNNQLLRASGKDLDLLELVHG